MKTFEEIRKEHPNIGAVVSIKSDGICKASLANMIIFEKIGEAVLKNKKFRAVLEYDPEELNSTFYIEFDEPGILLEVLKAQPEEDLPAKEQQGSEDVSNQHHKKRITCVTNPQPSGTPQR